jgi:hypothetical protein
MMALHIDRQFGQARLAAGVTNPAACAAKKHSNGTAGSAPTSSSVLASALTYHTIICKHNQQPVRACAGIIWHVCKLMSEVNPQPTTSTNVN